MKHLLFYDGMCPLCNRAVRFVLRVDRKGIFGFASLQGERAKRELADLNLESFDTLVLLQDYGTDRQKRLIEGRGGLRVLWLLGGRYAWLGWLSFLSPFLFNIVYRLIARNRYKLFKTRDPLDIPPDRFLND